MTRSAIAFVWGAMFALGLGVSGLTRADVIQGAMDVTGDWNPALFIAVTVVACIYQLTYRLMLRRGRPFFAQELALPQQGRIDGRLVLGSAMFGAGWGLAGMCPGATLVAFPGGDPRALVFVAALLSGIGVHMGLARRRLVDTTGVHTGAPTRARDNVTVGGTQSPPVKETKEKIAMLGFLYSVFAYLAFLSTFSGLGLFTDGLLLPKTVDSGAPAGLALALAVNIGLLLAWGVQHSVMARKGFKNWITQFVPVHLERATYVLVSSLALLGLMLGWQPMAGEVWQVESAPLVIALWSLNALGWFCVPVASFLIDHFDLFGLKQSFQQWRRGSYTRKGFVMPSLYRYVRHPMMTALLVGLWATPHMTVSHLSLSLGLTLYILIGLHFEERSLRRELGEAYAAYQQRVPKLLPRLGGPSELPVVAAPTTAQG